MNKISLHMAKIEETRINEVFGYERYYSDYDATEYNRFNIFVKDSFGKKLYHFYDGLTISEVFFVYLGIWQGMQDLASNKTIYKIKTKLK